MNTLSPRARVAGSAPVPRWPALALLVWMAIAAAAAALGALSPERMRVVPLAIVGSTLVLALAYRASSDVRAFADALDLRALVLFHAVRAPIGLGFLVLAARGDLDPTFAGVAGWGDIVAGSLALVACLATPASSRARIALVAAWNFVGLADILAVIATAQSILFLSGHPETMFALASFPWAMLPLFVVPLVVVSHAYVFLRLRRLAASASPLRA